jgi:hypothetical protein
MILSLLCLSRDETGNSKGNLFPPSSVLPWFGGQFAKVRAEDRGRGRGREGYIYPVASVLVVMSFSSIVRKTGAKRPNFTAHLI